MERNSNFELIPTAQISLEFPYGFRFHYEDPGLESHFERKGILLPILVVRDANQKWTVVSGHKRFLFARKRKLSTLSAHVIQDDFSKKELFLLSLFSNWNQQFSDLDRMITVCKAKTDFGFSLEEIQQDILPALGLPCERAFLEELQQVSRLIREIHILIYEKKIPFRGASSLNRFSKEEQLLLVEGVFGKVHLTTNQLILISEWIFDLKKIKRVSLGGLMEENTIQAILMHLKEDARAKGERFFTAIRLLRFPRLSEMEKNFDCLKQKVEQTKEIRLEHFKGFEKKGVRLQAEIKNREGISRVLRFLETHRDSFESFLK
ncbi:MAG: hypothetical protein HY447_02475 [Candidatus Omnitrophica bacterium]|nr:hypothetical protein [Candidatus Omnitrophota bacterium]